MNGMATISQLAVYGKSGLHKGALGVGLCLLLAQAGLAQTPAQLYPNLSDNSYYVSSGPSTGPYPPAILATNFDNEALFSINYSTYTSKPNEIFEPTYVLNYTNGANGVMTVNNPINLNQVILSLYSVAFQFDEGSLTEQAEAGTFYNQGTIRCDSTIDGNNIYSFDGLQIYELLGSGQCAVNATNIINPGNIDVSVNGSITLTGQNVDLSRGVFNVEPVESFADTLFGSALYNTINLSSTGAVGLDTNADWNPGADLQPGYALSSYVPISQYYLYLTNSTAYFRVDGAGTSNVIYRAVFVENNSPNAPYNVYIDPPNSIIASLDAGAAHVEWVGAYTDAATGNTATNYLYLTDDYALGATTNAGLTLTPINAGAGVPENFTFLTSTTPLFANPVASGFLNVFPDGNITNFYSYLNGQIVPSTVVTNITTTNPHGTIPNLPSRIAISATNELNLQNAIIGGENYLSLYAPNQFDGSAGAQIAAPYSDINLGVTNGALSFTNLLESQIPNWSGTIQAWSTRWTNTDTVTGITSDYRVLLVFSQLQPTTVPFVNSLRLHAGTNLVISDVLNVYGSFYTDAQRMTVTTNGVGFGATSAEGELNTIFPGNLGTPQWPNLRWVTNNGTIGAQGNISFTNVNNYDSVVNSGVIADLGTTIFATNFVNSGTITNGTGNLNVQCQTAILTNSYVYAAGSITIDSKSLLASNVFLQGLTLSLNPSNYLSDGGITNGSIWVIGRTNGTGGSGIALLSNPGNGDFLGTTISNTCPPSNKQDANTWAGQDYGAVNRGFTNNAAVGRLILDVQGNNSLITFTGAGNANGNSNALYVDSIEFRDSATNGLYNSYDFTNWVDINTNLVIYFAQAYIDGVSVAEKINIASLYNGKNGGKVSTNGTVLSPGRLRWVPTYAGYFSSTNFIINGVTNTFNAALAESADIDSNGNGLANAFDPAPFTLLSSSIYASQLDFTITLVKQPVKQALLSWYVPWNVPYYASNTVYFSTNLLKPTWQIYTNFSSINPIDAVNSPITVGDTNIARGIRFYKIVVQPYLSYPY